MASSARAIEPRLAARFDAAVATARRRVAGLRGRLAIPPPVDIADWIRDTVVLSKDSSAEGGSNLELYGYQKGAARVCQLPTTKEVAAVKGTRTGFTQLFCAIFGFHVGYEASPCGMWQPTEDKAKKFANSYWGPMFRDSPKLAKLVRKPVRGEIQDRWNERLYSNGGKFYCGYASSDDQFRGDTIRCTGGDEVDADGWRSGKAGSQGNKFKLMNERSRTFWNRKSYKWSSPLEQGSSNIWREWLASDQRRFFVRCPHCDERQYIEWGGAKTQHGIKWAVDADGVVVDAWYVCKGPKACRIEESSKFAMDAEAGEVDYTDPALDPQTALGWQPTRKPARPGLVGLHVPGYISLFAGAGWKQLAQEWLDCQGKPDDLKTFINNVLGEPTQDVAMRTVSVGGLGERAEPYPAEVPDGVVAITIGVDSQRGSDDQARKGAKPSRHEVSVWGWGRGEEAWLIGHYVLADHEPFSKEARAQLMAYIQRGWRKADGSELYASATFVDAGWMINEAIAFTESEELAGWNVWPIRGEAGDSARQAPVLGEREGLTKTGKKFLRVGVHGVKNLLDRRLRIATPGPGYVHFPEALRLAQHEVRHPLRDYFEDILAEGIKVDRRGREEWVRKGERTGEAWDCLVYCFAALQLAKRQFRRIASELLLRVMDQDEAEPEEALRYEGPDRSALTDLSVEMGIVAPAAPAQRRKPRHPTPAAGEAPAVIRSSYVADRQAGAPVHAAVAGHAAAEDGGGHRPFVYRSRVLG